MHTTPRFFGGRESTPLLREEQCFANPPSTLYGLKRGGRSRREEGGGRREVGTFIYPLFDILYHKTGIL